MVKMRAVVAAATQPDRLMIREVDRPQPGRSEALVRVVAFSLNRGEVKSSLASTDGTRPGWDLAGIVEHKAADGSGPAEGARVVGFVASGAWAELVAVPTNAIAELPDVVDFSQAAALPVGGLTALHAVERATGLLGRKSLVTGASGGVGLFACQLARLSGAEVVGVVRQEAHADVVRSTGTEQVVVSEDASGAKPFGPYRLVVESLGGQALANAMGMLDHDGVCVSFGATTNYEVTFNLWTLVQPGRASLYGLGLFNELAREPAAFGLRRLVRLLATNRLRTFVSVEAPWTDVSKVARELMERGFAGKAVLRVI